MMMGVRAKERFFQTSHEMSPVFVGLQVPAETFYKGYMSVQPARWILPEEEAQLVASSAAGPMMAVGCRWINMFLLQQN